MYTIVQVANVFNIDATHAAKFNFELRTTYRNKIIHPKEEGRHDLIYSRVGMTKSSQVTNLSRMNLVTDNDDDHLPSN